MNRSGNAVTPGNVLFSIPAGLFPAETEALFFDFFNSATPSEQSFLVTAESEYNAGISQVTVQQVPAF